MSHCYVGCLFEYVGALSCKDERIGCAVLMNLLAPELFFF